MRTAEAGDMSTAVAMTAAGPGAEPTAPSPAVGWSCPLPPQPLADDLILAGPAATAAIDADTLVIAPHHGLVAVRHLRVRLGDAHPGGPFTVAEDGRVLARVDLPFTPAGAALDLAAGEDDRIHLAGGGPWPADPKDDRQRRRAGIDHVLSQTPGVDRIIRSSWA